MSMAALALLLLLLLSSNLIALFLLVSPGWLVERNRW